ncbi:MAG: hypothetical protein ACEQSQ_00240 [Candidatus Paceibacteria bacterium]
MALVDDKNFTLVTTEWVLLLLGEGIITNMSGPNENLEFRFDSAIPGANDVTRTIYGRSDYDNKDSFANYSEDSKIYGRAKSGTVKILVSRMV